MKRTIKFRGKRVGTHEWVYGLLFQTPVGEWKIKKGFREYLVKPDTIGQFTGLLDRNGKEIYEGDILTCPEDVDFLPETVIFEEGCFMAKDDYTTIAMNAIDTDYRNITGNIFDNPELLK